MVQEAPPTSQCGGEKQMSIGQQVKAQPKASNSRRQTFTGADLLRMLRFMPPRFDLNTGLQRNRNHIASTSREYTVQHKLETAEKCSKDTAAIPFTCKHCTRAEYLVSVEYMRSRYFSEILDYCTDAPECQAAMSCGLPIKLVYIPLHRDVTSITNLVTYLEVHSGLVRISLQVGKMVLEWNKYGLLIPYYSDVHRSPRAYACSGWTECIQLYHEPDVAVELDYILTAPKKDTIDALIQIIIRYNAYYYYHPVYQNSQQFVADALNVLEVELPEQLQLTENLQMYFAEVAKQCNPQIPKTFQTHGDLDKYVDEKDLHALTQLDLEFILTVYFQFHFESKKKVVDDKKLLREWVCEEVSCHMVEVEGLIDYNNLFIHNFRHKDFVKETFLQQ